MLSTSTKVYCTILFVFGLIWWIWRAVAVKGLMKNLAGPSSTSWFTGNLTQLDNLTFNHEIVKKYGGAAKVHGLFGDEQLYFSDPLALRTIVLTNYLSFPETQLFTVLNKLPFGAAMTTVHADQHKRLRRLLNPLFSPSNIRALVPIVSETASQAAEILKGDIIHNGENVNIMDILSRAVLEVLGRAVFGYSFDILKNTSSQGHFVKLFFPSLEKLGILTLLLPVLVKIGTATFRRRIVNLIPSRRVQALKAVIDAINQLGNDVLFDRQAALISGGYDPSDHMGRGKDIVTLLLQENYSASAEDRLSEEDIAAQIRLFIFAGSDTTSAALCRVFEELAQHPEVQETLRKEALQTNLHGSFSYEAIKGLKYLHAVVQETLRLHPPTIKLDRIATQDTLVPLHIPVKGTDGKMINEILVAKNQNVILGIANCNRDVAIWGDDAADWKPERWLSPLPESLVRAQVPGIFPNIMSFLGGERSCIGYNFALMEMKVILLTFITQFKFSMPDNERAEWKIDGIQYPVVPGKGLQLPLIVTLF